MIRLLLQTAQQQENRQTVLQSGDQSGFNVATDVTRAGGGND